MYLSGPESFMCFRITRMSVMSALRRKREKNLNVNLISCTPYFFESHINLVLVMISRLFSVTSCLKLVGSYYSLLNFVFDAQTPMSIFPCRSPILFLCGSHIPSFVKRIYGQLHRHCHLHVFSMTRFQLMVPFQKAQSVENH